MRIIDGVLAAMPAGFGLTMAPETAYVTGGSVVYGSIWGSYLPIIKKYADNGRLWWLNMQYYNGSMYDCAGNSYAARHGRGIRRADPVPRRRPDRAGHDDPGCRSTSRSPACRPSPVRAAGTCRRRSSRRRGRSSVVRPRGS